MALGLGSKKEDGNSSPSESNEKTFGNEGYYNGFQPDTEAQNGGPRKMSRIDRPVTKSISGNLADGRRMSADADASSEDITVGKQMELEAGNAIQYRTCSWQKV